MMNCKYLIVSVMFFVSCGDSKGPDVERVEKELVFGSRNVEQIRGTMSRSQSEAAGSAEKAYAYQAAQLARATATITPKRFKPNKPRCEIRAGVGSATLTSDSRLTTAYHVVDGAVEDYAAYFESSPILRNYSHQLFPENFNSIGQIPPDASESQYNPSWEYTTAHRSDAIEESPFLANRLFVLGLDKWSHPEIGKTARLGLRGGFNFIIDQVLPGQEGYTPNSRAGQGFVVDSAQGGFIGRDIAVLTFTRNPYVTNLEPLSTGDFAVNKPAVFFGKVQMEDSEQHPFQEETNFLNHTAPWPHLGSIGIGQLVPLTSFQARAEYIREQRTLQNSSCRGDEPVDMIQTNLFQTSFDSVTGSSGGIVLTPHSAPGEENGADPTLVGVGFLSGPSTDTLNLRMHRHWVEPVGTTNPSTFAAVNITGTLRDDVKLFNRDHISVANGDPSNPTPKIEGVFPECIEFVETSDGLVCKTYETGEPAEPDGGFGPPKDPILEGEDAERIGAGRSRRFGCNHHRFGTPPGVMVGIHGGLALNGMNVSESAQDVVNNGGGIGSFFGICAPYSSAAYTDNWRFLLMRGAQNPRELDTLGGPWGWGNFDEYQSRVYEERSVEGDVYVRPPSTRMCPPNYLLKGLSLSTLNQHYSGVQELICVKPESSTLDIPDEIRLPLEGEDSHYTLDGKAFGLSQYIGLPGSCGNGCGDAACDPGLVVWGMETSHDNVGRLTKLRLLCQKSP